MAKSLKQDVREEDFTLDLGNIGAMAQQKKEKPKKEIPGQQKEQQPEIKQRSRVEAKEKSTPKVIAETEIGTKKHLRLVVSKEQFNEFEALFKRFVEETETYWVNTSRVHIFVLGTLFLEKKYIKANTYFEAPDDFITFISRKGNRPKSEESTLRKLEPTPMFFEVDAHVFQSYFNIIYSFLLIKDDVHNLSYSAPYFFKDFLEQLQNSFKAFCTFGKKNS